MRCSLLSILVVSLFLSACATNDKNNALSSIPKPIKSQSEANNTDLSGRRITEIILDSTVLTLDSNNNVASLSNVVRATFSPQDAKNNPVITIKKVKDEYLVEAYNSAKEAYNMENSSDYEVTLSSSKPLSSTVDMELSVPIELLRSLNDKNALEVYVVDAQLDDCVLQHFATIISTYNPETQKLLVTLPVGSLEADDKYLPVHLQKSDDKNRSFNIIIKIGLITVIKVESNPLDKLEH